MIDAIQAHLTDTFWVAYVIIGRRSEELPRLCQNAPLNELQLQGSQPVFLPSDTNG